MLVLNKEAIEQCYSMSEAIAASKEALMMYTKGDAIVPPRIILSLPEHGGKSLYMPAYTKGDVSSSGVKIASVYPGNIKKGLSSINAMVLTLDPETGIVDALLDGTYLTQVRTAAVQGAATDVFSRKNSTIGAVIGSGGQAYQQTIAMLTVRNLKEVRVYDIDYERAKDFAKMLTDTLSSKFNATFVATKSAKEAVTDADIITTVTTSKVETFKACDVKKGAHINGIGSYTPQMHEIPKDIFNQTKKIYFDTKEGVLSEAGDILTPLDMGLFVVDDCHEIGNVLLGKAIGRTSDEEITVFKSVGSAVLDVVTAKEVVDKAKAENIGIYINI